MVKMDAQFVYIMFILAFYRCFRRESFAKGDTFASIAQMEQVLNLERELGDSLQKFVALERKRLDKMKDFAKSVRDATDQVKNAGLKILENPVATYGLIKRFAYGWTELDKFLSKDHSKELQNLLQLNKKSFPSYEDDVVGAIAALFRLQDTYNISATDMINNNIPGCGPAPRLLAEDCFEVGSLAYRAGRYGRGLDWLTKADHMIRNGQHDGTVNHVDVLEHLAWIEYVKGNPQRALDLTMEMLKMVPNNEQAKENIMHYQNIIDHNLPDNHQQLTAKEEETNTKSFTNGEYATLCRGNTSKARPQGNLLCWYQGQNDPQLKIRPIKVEMVFRKPRLLIFRDLVSPSEAKRIKDVAMPKLKRATVFNRETGVLENADYRVSKSAWLDDKHDTIVETLSRRIGAVTGLEMNTAEPLQIANYGMAGQYEYHVDFGDPGSPLDISKHGNRVATVLIYLNDVSAGGYTVFTKAKTYVSPSMGDAAFWHNLKLSGAGDYETEHAACPVLCGNKWVANKWIHIRGQEFKRKCSLTRDV